MIKIQIIALGDTKFLRVGRTILRIEDIISIDLEVPSVFGGSYVRIELMNEEELTVKGENATVFRDFIERNKIDGSIPSVQ